MLRRNSGLDEPSVCLPSASRVHICSHNESLASFSFVTSPHISSLLRLTVCDLEKCLTTGKTDHCTHHCGANQIHSTRATLDFGVTGVNDDFLEIYDDPMLQ